MMTIQKSYSVKEADLKKTKEEAFAMGKKYSALAFNFGGYGNTDNYYIIDTRTFKKFLEYIDELEGGT